MNNVTLITGNKKKAEYFTKYIGMEIDHIDLDLDEIQSMSVAEVATHKVKQAYEIIKKPVLVEDVSLEFKALGSLPGPFIKFFLGSMKLEEICNLLKDKSREAVARCVIGYYDGTNLKIFEGKLDGTIAITPFGENGFGWDHIFIPEGYTVTRSELNEEEYAKTYFKLKRTDLVKEYLEEKNIKKL